jgi:hypothetical protein
VRVGPLGLPPAAALPTISLMPEVARFDGVRVALYYHDHPPPHVHVHAGGQEASIAIADGDLLSGALPRRQRALFEEWRVARVDELLAAWEEAVARRQLPTMEER